jgi:hypothetical protein
MAVDVKEYAAFTGVTEGYATEILKDEEHAKWHMPSGLAKLEKAAELMADMNDDVNPVVDPVDPTENTGAGEVEDTGDGADLDDEGTEEDPDGGSVEGEE